VGWNHFRSSTKTDGQSTVGDSTAKDAPCLRSWAYWNCWQALKYSRPKAVNTFAIVVGFATRKLWADDLVSYYSSSHHSEMLCLACLGGVSVQLHHNGSVFRWPARFTKRVWGFWYFGRHFGGEDREQEKRTVKRTNGLRKLRVPVPDRHRPASTILTCARRRRGLSCPRRLVEVMDAGIQFRSESCDTLQLPPRLTGVVLQCELTSNSSWKIKSISDIRNLFKIKRTPCAIIHEKWMPRTRVAVESLPELEEMTRAPMKTTEEMHAILDDLARRAEIEPAIFDELN